MSKPVINISLLIREKGKSEPFWFNGVVMEDEKVMIETMGENAVVTYKSAKSVGKIVYGRMR